MKREMTMTSSEQQAHVCRGLCDAVKATTWGDLRSRAAAFGLELEQAWRASTSAQGFIVAAAWYWNGTENHLVVAFRSMQGKDEWMEYPKEYFDGTRFTPHEGKAAEGCEVFSVWTNTLNQTWGVRGNEKNGSKDTLRDMIWRQLNAGGGVWLTGHSKGGAVATTASSRLLFGDSVNDTTLPDKAVRRPTADKLMVLNGPLSRLSVTTFNAPKAFKSKLAAMYNQALHDVGGQHVRVKHNKAGLLRKAPPIFVGMRRGGADHRTGNVSEKVFVFGAFVGGNPRAAAASGLKVIMEQCCAN